MRQSLKYLAGADCDVVKTKQGYRVVHGIEQYENARCREKVVFRLDLLRSLNQMFSEESLSKYRKVIFSLISGQFDDDPSKVSQLLKALYKEDKVFRVWLGMTYYFTDVLKQVSLWQYIIESAKSSVSAAISKVDQICATTGISPITTSSCYYYLATADVNCDVAIPDGYAEEVVSRAKVWKGTFKKVGA